MTIDRLNPLDPIQPKKPSGVTRADRNSGSDSVSLSSEAVVKAELFKALELAKAAPDVRMDRVAELKAKIDDPNYINDAVLSATADRILEQLL
ncbi:MAG: flagellar biosynthesis anti-sigma factor FlgM [Spirochaetes bacterium]|nr:flagellar biosynthesis anti-sigma factor FlgM [Spirochaetota bacterium]MBU1081095.1 flagellar biosynthesis anti-sigma factor FlgM [Spirochaetota bacterium]